MEGPWDSEIAPLLFAITRAIEVTTWCGRWSPLGARAVGPEPRWRSTILVSFEGVQRLEFRRVAGASYEKAHKALIQMLQGKRQRSFSNISRK